MFKSVFRNYSMFIYLNVLLFFLPEIIKSNVFTFQKIYNLFERHTHAASLYVSKDCARLSFIHQSVSNESCSARKNVTCGTSSSTFKILFTTFCFILTTFSDTLSPNNSYFDFGQRRLFSPNATCGHNCLQYSITSPGHSLSLNSYYIWVLSLSKAAVSILF